MNKKDKEFKCTLVVESVPIKVEVSDRFDAEYNKPRIFFFPKNENVVENFDKRFNSPQDTWKKMGKAVLKQLKYPGVDVLFSQYAGCSCGCSPGLIVDLHEHRCIFVDYNL